jgi:1-acyl-sn-glycerol-3-phosphate acyltransferase
MAASTRATHAQDQESYRVEPHQWQTRLWARLARRLGRHWVVSRHVQRYCTPFTVRGRDRLRGMRGPALIMVNHTSHFDTVVAFHVLPEHVRSRTAVAAAADRFYRRSKRGWWFSLFYNAFPIDRRGGGANTLAYPRSLLERGWSVLIYPEGTRSTTGEMGAFHHGVSMLALQARVPVIPIHTQGLPDVMPKGQRTPMPAPVRVQIGAPVWLNDVASVPEGTARLEQAMRDLAAEHRRPAGVAAPWHPGRRSPARVMRTLTGARRG